jgi:hypothetical protein
MGRPAPGEARLRTVKVSRGVFKAFFVLVETVIVQDNEGKRPARRSCGPYLSGSEGAHSGLPESPCAEENEKEMTRVLVAGLLISIGRNLHLRNAKNRPVA